MCGLSIDGLFLGLDTFKLGVAICDRSLRYEAINSALAEMHNLPQNVHLGKTLREVIGPLADEVTSSFNHVFTTGQPLPNVERVGKFPRRAEAGRWLAYYFPLKGSNGQVIRVGAFVLELKLGPVFGDEPVPAIKTDPRDYGQPFHLEEAHPSEGSKMDRKAVVLSPREQEVLRLLAVGKSNREIASILGISLKTVEAHRSRVMLKIDASSIVYLVHYAIRHHIVAP